MVLSISENLKAEQKKLPTCPKCKSELDNRVPRSFVVKNLLFFLPIKRYICYKCQRKRYIIR
jgi:ribosomal protein L37AE/L43A